MVEEWGEIVEDTGNAGTSYLDTNTTLELGKVYWYSIRAINGQGPGEWSEVTSVLINPQVPSAPRRFQADAQSLGVVMSWLEPLDNGTGGSINNYEVWRHNGTEWVQVHTTEDGDTLFWLDVANSDNRQGVLVCCTCNK